MSKKNPAVDPASPLERVVLLFAFLTTCLDLFAAFNATGGNWGFHHLSFFPDGIKLTVPFLMMLVLTRRVRKMITGALERMAAGFDARPRLFRYGVFASCLCCAALIFWMGRQGSFFLGDGYLALRNLHAAQLAENVALSFKREPLTGLLTLKLYRLFQSLNLQSADQAAFQTLSILSGIGSLVVIYQIAKLFTQTAADRLFAFLLIVTTGAAQLFFGYVENYSLSFFGLLLFAYTGIAFTHQKVKIFVPIAAFGLLITMHFGMVVMLPAVGILLYNAFKEEGAWPIVRSLLIMVVSVLFILFLSDFTVDTFLDVIGRTSVHLVPLQTSQESFYAYSLFSLDHAMDWLNFVLLIQPIAFATLAFVLFRDRLLVTLRPIVFSFLFAIALFGMLFTLTINCELGMSRDWDLLAPFGAGVVVFAVYVWSNALKMKTLRREFLVMIVLVSGLHVIPWVAMNADENKSIARFEMLRIKELWSRHAFANAYEELSIYYKERGDHSRSTFYLEKYISVDTTNTRLWMNLGSAYNSLGESEKAIVAYERLVQLDPGAWEIQMNLGILYASKRNFPRALASMNKALEVHPGSAILQNNMGSLLLESGSSPANALPHFLLAIEIDPGIPQSYYNASFCYGQLGDQKRSSEYLSEYERVTKLVTGGRE